MPFGLRVLLTKSFLIDFSWSAATIFLTGESEVENPYVPSNSQNLDNSILSGVIYLMFHVSAIAEIGFFNSPVKIGGGNTFIIGFQIADFQFK